MCVFACLLLLRASCVCWHALRVGCVCVVCDCALLVCLCAGVCLAVCVRFVRVSGSRLFVFAVCGWMCVLFGLFVLSSLLLFAFSVQTSVCVVCWFSLLKLFAAVCVAPCVLVVCVVVGVVVVVVVVWLLVCSLRALLFFVVVVGVVGLVGFVACCCWRCRCC